MNGTSKGHKSPQKNSTKSSGKKIDFYHFDLQNTLGKGNIGEVYKGVDTIYNRSCAVKMIPLERVRREPPTEWMDKLKADVARITKLTSTCDNIAKFYDVKRTSNNLYVVTEFCEDGNLRDYISHKKRIRSYNEDEVIIIMRQILAGMKCLYDNSIILRNIRPQNILISQGLIKLTDFVYTNQLEEYFEYSYASPQILLGNSYHRNSDIWSLGVIFYELCYWRLPWRGEDPELLSKIRSRDLQFPDTQMVSHEMKCLLQGMLTFDEAHRIKWEDLLYNPMFYSNSPIPKLTYKRVRKEPLPFHIPGVIFVEESKGAPEEEYMDYTIHHNYLQFEYDYLVFIKERLLEPLLELTEGEPPVCKFPLLTIAVFKFFINRANNLKDCVELKKNLMNLPEWERFLSTNVVKFKEYRDKFMLEYNVYMKLFMSNKAKLNAMLTKAGIPPMESDASPQGVFLDFLVNVKADWVTYCTDQNVLLISIVLLSIIQEEIVPDEYGNFDFEWYWSLIIVKDLADLSVDVEAGLNAIC